MTYTKRDPAVQMTARSYAFLSVAAALITIILKSAAYLLTGSVGLLSDALESLANLAAALVAVWALTLAAQLTPNMSMGIQKPNISPVPWKGA